MRLHYVSPSTLPSRAANSVHVMWQCEGLCRAGAEVTLYAKRSIADAAALPEALRQAYGVEHPALRLDTIHHAGQRGDNLRIAWHAVRAIGRAGGGDAILSRNLYAAYALAVLQRRPLLFETHQLETGVRRHLQRAVMRSPHVTTIVISDALAHHLAQHHGVGPRHAIALHDAAPAGIEPVPPAARRPRLAALVPQAAGAWRQVCGYFGHLYPGRGIEIVAAMAAGRPDCLFLVYGGNESDLAARRRENTLPNLAFMGHVPHPVAQERMRLVDVLLMPYQAQVSIGVAGHDTARWMSPMKMFEYLGAGVPVISSDLPVLREVLQDGVNCLLVPPADATAWLQALARLDGDPAAAQAIGERAHAQYAAQHTWTRRAERLLEAARQL